jgi:probable biosynthetic protein (TIGR04098 family)
MAALRHGRWREHLGLVRSDVAPLGRLVIDPCPAQDFNGAAFLYFSSAPNGLSCVP